MARPAPEFEEEDNLDAARQLIYAENYQGIVDRFGETLVMPAVKSSIRSGFVASVGHRFNVSDLNAIETRVGAWLAGCRALLAVFARPDGDPYLEFASKMTGIPYDDLYRDYHYKGKDPEKLKLKAIAKRHRQMAKPGVLGCVYRLGAGGWGRNKYGDPIKVGLWGYAENMGVHMTLEQSQEVVRVFREYEEIKQLWYDFENCVREVLKGPKKATASLGPGGCIKFDKINRKGQNPILRIQLPSGRFLHYIDARIEDTMMPWKQTEISEGGQPIQVDVYRPTLVYAGVNQDTKQWESFVTSHGGKLTENVVQAIARDVLAEGMLRADAEGFSVSGHVHDEIITEGLDNPFESDYKDLEHLMSVPMPWAPDLPLGAEGYSGNYYHK
jgi:DNA polymerase